MATEFKLSYTGQEIDEKLGNAGVAITYSEQTLIPEQQAQARKNIGAVNAEQVADIAVPKNVKLAIYRILSSAVTTEVDLTEQLDSVYAWAIAQDEPDAPDEPTAELLEFDLIMGNVTFAETWIKYSYNNNGSQSKRAEMNPFCVVHDPDYQYKVKLGTGDYKMEIYCLSGTINDETKLRVDGTRDVALGATGLTRVYYESFLGGGELVVPACDYFYVHTGRVGGTELTETDMAWLRQNFTVERVRA